MAARDGVDARLSAALAAVLGGKRGRVLALSGAAAALDVAGVGEVRERDLVDALKRGKVPDVLAVLRPSPTLVRALRDHPPALLVVVDDLDDEAMAALHELQGVAVLGPRAALRTGDGDVIACAHARGELEGLVRALGSVRLAISPTPAWLPSWLDDPALASARVAGTVPARSLGPAWARWAARMGPEHAVVPVGVETPTLERGRAQALLAVAAAHGLERFTGPVFPSPRVVALVLHGLRQGGAAVRRGEDRDDDVRALWAQARRALPIVGATVGMEAPDSRLPLDSPTAAFLAQRALLRVAQARTIAGEPLAAPVADDEAMARARQVLADAPESLSDQESKVVLRGVGIGVTRQAVATSASGASGFADRIGYPVVLKALSADLRRRAEIGAVVLDVGTPAAVRRAYAQIVDAVEQRAPTARLDGVLVAEHVPDGVDVHVGVLRLGKDALVAHARVISASTALEPVLALLPLHAADARLVAHAVLSRLPVPALRRATDPDESGLADLLLRLSSLVESTGDRIVSIDLVPVRFPVGLGGGSRGHVVLDARMVQRAHLEGV